MPDKPHFPLRIFYDGACSVCAAEMDLYRRKDRDGRLVFIDISSASFAGKDHGFTQAALMAEMHAMDSDGRVYRGVDAFRAIWRAFPTSPWLSFLAMLVSLPAVAPLAKVCYRHFARIRKYLPKRHGACDSGVCHR